MEDKTLLPEILNKTSKDFSTNKIEIPTEETGIESYDSLKEYLTQKVAELMDKDFERFLNNLYRIDVDENKVKGVMGDKNVLSIPEKITELIIERQIERIKYQRMYKEGKL
ncbi:MAG: hypothetical protein PVH88_16270 [Ignavibacteria bacterium]|jgi:hypothetical protein